MRCVVFGATGYLGGRLVPELVALGHQVRAVARTPAKLDGAPWRSRVEVVRADVTDPDAVATALADQEVLYYLVHSLHRPDFVELDRRAAFVVARAARVAGVRRIVYLGGLLPAPGSGRLSPHLASRAQTGQILRTSGVPTAELRAAVVLGSGSASFEILRYLTERLPVMLTPRWVRNRVQPIAVRDVLWYLTRAATLPAEVNRAFDIGGPDVLTYQRMMLRYARVAGLPRRLVVPVAVLSPWLSAQWINLVTPVPRAIALPLIESLVHEAVCHEHDITRLVGEPPGGLIRCDRAIALALNRVRRADVPTRWSDASTTGAPADPLPTDPPWSGGSVYQDLTVRYADADPSTLWRVIESIGGERGWYSAPLAWSARGWIDRLTGGVGLRRGRRDPHRLRPGEALDWWRVERVEHGRLLRLRAEMRLPGQAWLELSCSPNGGGAVYRQRAVFRPRGLAGHLYWLGVLAVHRLVFGGMARNITGAAARRRARAGRRA
jgi:uncharacterized protein YbjT (DUF2867 family)